MAGGRFIPGVSKDRPGVYTNFEDIDKSLLSAGAEGAGGGGGGSKIKPGDYLIGKIAAMTVSCLAREIVSDFAAAAEDVYCGVLVFN